MVVKVNYYEVCVPNGATVIKLEGEDPDTNEQDWK
jgi:hypothetical protein